MTDIRVTGLKIKQIYDLMEKHANNHLRPLNLTISQVNVLFALRMAENHELTLKQLEGQLMIQSSTSTGLVSRMKEKGFVETHGSEDDARITIVSLTAAGDEISDIVEKDILSTENKLTSLMTRKEEEQFNTLLGKALDAIK